MLKNTSSSYGLITKLFHWVLSIAIIIMLTVGFIMVSMPPSDNKFELYSAHKATGVIVLSLVILRFLWRLVNTGVHLPNDISNFEKLASKTAHYLLYVFMFLMPLSGMLMSRYSGYEVNVFDLFTIPPLEKDMHLAEFFNKIHVMSAFAFTALIALHICGGLYHHFIRKDNILMRMIK